MNWQPIETAPRDGTQLILWVPASLGYLTGRIEMGSFRVDTYLDYEGPRWLDNYHDEYSTGWASNRLEPTHWMPLPEPPA